MDSNAAIKVLKYFMVNCSRLLKGYHNRTYFYSSGTILARVGSRLKRYMHRLLLLDADESGTEEEDGAGDDGEEEDGGGEEEGGGGEEGGEEVANQTAPKKKQDRPPMDPESMLRKVVNARYCTYTCMCVYVQFCTSM